MINSPDWLTDLSSHTDWFSREECNRDHKIDVQAPKVNKSESIRCDKYVRWFIRAGVVPCAYTYLMASRAPLRRDWNMTKNKNNNNNDDDDNNDANEDDEKKKKKK